MTENGTPIRTRRPALAASAIALVAAGAIALTSLPLKPAYAQEGAHALPIIRDTEIERLLRDYARPILKVAGLAQQHIKVVIINSPAFNAFVMDGRHIFVNSGALMETRTPNELIGVFAHETGHLADGHLMRRREKLAQAQTQSIIAMLLGVGAMVAAGQSGGSAGQIGPAALLAPQAAIQNSMLAYSRSQEDRADHAALKFLYRTHQSAKGMVDLFKRLARQDLFSARYADPYLQNHPMPATRVATLEAEAKASPYWNKKDPPALQLRHDLMRAKLSGFLESEGTVLRRYPMSNQSLPARYARAIATYRHGRLQNAIAQIDGLIESEPTNPYFHELKGQALLDDGRPAEAIPSLRRAVRLSHGAPLIETMLAKCLIAVNKPEYREQAIDLLRSALERDPTVPGGYDQLAMAYGHKGDYAHADLASARAAYARGDLKTARMLASRAKTRFPVGSPAWVQADDLVNVSPLNGQKRN